MARKAFYRDMSYSRAADGVAVNGFVASSDSGHLEQFLDSERISDALGVIEGSVDRVAVLRNLRVEPFERGRGVGTDALARFIEHAEGDGAEAILLICDTLQDNLFDLEEWYQRSGFRTFAEINGSYPAMIRCDDPGLVTALAQVFGHAPELF